MAGHRLALTPRWWTARNFSPPGVALPAPVHRAANGEEGVRTTGRGGRLERSLSAVLLFNPRGLITVICPSSPARPSPSGAGCPPRRHLGL